ncbi:MAG TPA: hypothetical protein VFM05_10075, partial [Candidatus Saccharimonadales bacterium]|nr:hypothetical protein [Candidatus Saccharimonadales bacterium]
MMDDTKIHGKIASKHYALLLVMVVLHFFAMYILMYAMVDSFDNIFANFNQVYMAALMSAPMFVIEVALMWSMFHSRTWNLVIITAGIVLFIASFVFIRQQTAIADKQFLRSMIPHHAGAILMCEKAKLED